MKNVADFKKRIKVGCQIDTIYHQASGGRSEDNSHIIYVNKALGIREVSIVQNNSFALKTEKSDGTFGTFTDSWCSFPKASQCKFLDENTIQILEEDYRVRTEPKPLIPILTYKFV